MKTATTDIEWLVTGALRLIAAVNLCFVLLLVVVMFLASWSVHAESTVCTGRNLVNQLSHTNPDLLKDIQSQASATPNGLGLLWRIVKTGTEPSYLFGTMHLSDPRIVSIPDNAQLALDSAATVVIETTDILDPKIAANIIARNPELMVFTDGSTITDRLSSGDRTVMETGLRERSFTVATVDRMKPWMISAILALPACEWSRKNSGEPFLDLRLATLARERGKPLLGLESMAEQLGAMASLPMDFHMRGLIGSLKISGEIDDLMETMIELYVTGQTGMILPVFGILQQDDEKHGYRQFMQTMVLERNHIMASRLQPILDLGNAFVAVGALHLPGNEGLIALLRDAGYRLTAAD